VGKAPDGPVTRVVPRLDSRASTRVVPPNR
jgi:hypothetical protein